MPRPMGTGGSFVRWKPARGKETSGQLYIAPVLYREIGEPARVVVERSNGRTLIRPARPGETHAVYTVVIPGGARGGMPRVSIGRIVALHRELQEGRTDAEVRGIAIVF